MNASRLREIIEKLVESHSQLRIQKRLDAVIGALTNLVSSPSEPSYQTALRESLDALSEMQGDQRERFQPAEIARLNELNGGPEFLEDISSLVAEWISENPATPNVALTNLRALASERLEFILNAENLLESLKAFGVEVDELEADEAEIGFLLPRNLFRNEFDKLIKELSVVNRIIRSFSEISTGSAEKIEVRQISTTDPVFTFGLCTATIIAIGKAATWALQTWKSVEEIRQIRAQTANIQALKESGFEALLEGSIRGTIEQAIAEEVEKLVSSSKADEARKNEQRADLSWALESILARVERGMSIEIRLLPPPETEADDDGNAAVTSKNVEETATARAVAAQLVFPRMAQDPILKLPAELPERRRRSSPRSR